MHHRADILIHLVLDLFSPVNVGVGKLGILHLMHVCAFCLVERYFVKLLGFDDNVLIWGICSNERFFGMGDILIIMNIF